MKSPLFYAKILLFGEYGIINDSKALTIPFNLFKGALKKEKKFLNNSLVSNKILNKFKDYLKTQNLKLNLKKFDSDIEEGLYFDSTIPEGYGVGSSGALVAAVYERYAINRISILENLDIEKLLKLKMIFSKMESFFHGNSSGLDPLNSYLSLPILVNSKTEIKATGIPSQTHDGNNAVFLLDSGTKSETSSLVSIFLNKLKIPAFKKMIDDEFIKSSDLCIEYFLGSNNEMLFNEIKKLSSIVLEHFKPMIPSDFQKTWKDGIDNNTFYLKLCGSGGGGYILGFTKDILKTKSILNNRKLKVVYTF